jgi:hypothetical protein
MMRRDRSLIILHGAALVLLGLLLGLPAVAEELAGTHPTTWRAGHAALLQAGVWLLATAAVAPQLALPPGQMRALCWSLLVTAYAFTTAVIVQAMTGVRALSLSASIATSIAYVANIVTVGAGVLAAALTLLGAAAALKRGEQRTESIGE